MTQFYKQLFLASLLLTVALPAYPQQSGNSQVMLFGTFHFANPGKDAVKTEQINVMTEENQAYLAGLSERIAAFKPTHVLIECEPAVSEKYQTEFNSYLGGNEPLGSNENYQLGFRVAKLAGLSGVTCYNASYDWKAEQLFEYMSTQDQATKQEFDAEIARITAKKTADHQNLTLKQLLNSSNDPSADAVNKNLYLMTNVVGAGAGFEGADAAASWWQRNFRMYANIQKVAVPGSKVVVFGGQGHTAILKDLLADDLQRTAEPVIPYL
jgi:hypothetical protein